jgi:hypothetical protein
MTDAEATVRFSILNAIAGTGTKFIRPHVDCAPLVDAIVAELRDPAVAWASQELFAAPSPGRAEPPREGGTE